jgi:hypothetical protein
MLFFPGIDDDLSSSSLVAAFSVPSPRIAEVKSEQPEVNSSFFPPLRAAQTYLSSGCIVICHGTSLQYTVNTHRWYRTSKRSTHSHFLISIHRTLFSTLVFSSFSALSTRNYGSQSLQLLPLSMVKKNSKEKRVTRTKKLTVKDKIDAAIGITQGQLGSRA